MFDKKPNLRGDILAGAFAMFLCMTGTALGKDAVEQVVKADTPDKFAALVAKIESEMQQGGRYEFINPTGRAEVEKNLDAMMTMIKSAGSVDAMKHDDQVALFNLQEKVNGVLANNASDRLVCRSAPRTGSHIASTDCKTFAQMAADKRALDSKLRSGDASIDDPNGSDKAKLPGNRIGLPHAPREH